MGIYVFKKDGHTKKIHSFEITYKGFFDLDQFYNNLYFWIKDEGFSDADGDKDRWERLYYQSKNTAGGVFHHIWWRLIKDPFKDKYLKYFVNIDMRTIFIVKKEEVINGKKVKGWNGEFTIKMESYLILDAEEKWRKSSFLRAFHELWKNKIYKGKIDEAVVDLYKTTIRIQEKVKKFFEMYNTVMSPPEDFMPMKKGFKKWLRKNS